MKLLANLIAPMVHTRLVKALLGLPVYNDADSRRDATKIFPWD